MLGQTYADPATLPTLYKITGPNGEPIHGGSGQWSLPRDGKPGAWWTLEGDIVPCRNALHVTDAAHLDRWYDDTGYRNGPGGQVIHRVEVRGTIINAGDKYAVSSARLLPHVGGPVPDVAAAEAEYAAVIDKASRAYDRAIRKATRPLPKVPAGWAAYLAVVGSYAVPQGHPAYEYAAAVRAIDAAKSRAAAARDAAIYPARARLAEVRASARLAGI